jgi:hypothetical protein
MFGSHTNATGTKKMLALRSIIAATCLAAAIAPSAVAQSRTSRPAPSASADLRTLVADLAFELRLVYRDNLPEYTRRHEKLREAIIAWNASSRSAAERREMADWLRSAIRRSMPGSAQPMPPLPMIGEVGREESGEGDPFRDDPL